MADDESEVERLMLDFMQDKTSADEALRAVVPMGPVREKSTDELMREVTEDYVTDDFPPNSWGEVMSFWHYLRPEGRTS